MGSGARRTERRVVRGEESRLVNMDCILGHIFLGSKYLGRNL